MDALLPVLKDYVEFVKDDWPSLAIYVSIMIIWLWSGCWSASIAENRIRSPWLWFVIGLLVPIVCPFVILFKLPVYVPPVEVVEDEAPQARVDGPPPVNVAPPASIDVPPEMVDTEMLEAPGHAYDQNYFRQIAKDVSGDFRGPFQLIVKGNECKVEKIIDPMTDVVMVEFISSDGKEQKMRIPYKNIESCTEI